MRGRCDRARIDDRAARLVSPPLAENYLECSKDERRAQVIHKDLESLARRFNDEVRAFKAANPTS